MDKGQSLGFGRTTNKERVILPIKAIKAIEALEGKVRRNELLPIKAVEKKILTNELFADKRDKSQSL